MKITPLEIEGVWVAESPIWSDDRGFFREWFKSEALKNATGHDFEIEQANISLSSKGTLRGIHYSIAQGHRDHTPQTTPGHQSPWREHEHHQMWIT
jgi:dTDP-4-dehydrorhamnose 3,5-epimerase